VHRSDIRLHPTVCASRLPSSADTLCGAMVLPGPMRRLPVGARWLQERWGAPGTQPRYSVSLFANFSALITPHSRASDALRCRTRLRGFSDLPAGVGAAYHYGAEEGTPDTVSCPSYGLAESSGAWARPGASGSSGSRSASSSVVVSPMMPSAVTRFVSVTPLVAVPAVSVSASSAFSASSSSSARVGSTCAWAL